MQAPNARAQQPGRATRARRPLDAWFGPRHRRRLSQAVTKWPEAFELAGCHPMEQFGVPSRISPRVLVEERVVGAGTEASTRGLEVTPREWLSQSARILPPGRLPRRTL